MNQNMSKFQKLYTHHSEFHNNSINIIIHIITFPLLTLGYLSLLNYIPISFSPTKNLLEVNLPFIHTIILCIYYLYLNLFFGIITNFWMIFFYFFGRQIFLDFENTNSFLGFCFFFFVFLAPGLIQVLGHKFFEQRSTKFRGNLTALYCTPLFVTVDALRFFGLKKELFVVVDSEIERRNKEFLCKKGN